MCLLCFYCYYSVLGSTKLKCEISDEEVKFSLIIPANNDWGYYMRKEKSVRILFYGGSNTMKIENHSYYPDLLEKYLRTNGYFSNTSYTNNRGLGGAGPIQLIQSPDYGTPGDDTSLWPNVVFIEFAINTEKDFQSSAGQVDLLIQMVKRYYKEKGANIPSFALIEVFQADRSLFLDSDRPFSTNGFEGYMRGTTGPFLLSLARFYQIPYISVTDALYPSYVRHFLSHPETELWPCIKEDGHHLTEEGHKVIAEKILGPFIIDNFRPRESDKTYIENPMRSVYPKNILMQPLKTYTKEVVDYWSGWGVQSPEHKLERVVMPSRHWRLQLYKNDSQRLCHTSSTVGSVGMYRFDVPSACDSQCKLAIMYLASWNSSYIGDMKCLLFTGKNTTGVKAFSSHVVMGNLGHNWGTIAAWTTIAHGLSSGTMTLKCRKLDTRFACVSGLSINTGGLDSLDPDYARTTGSRCTSNHD